MFYVVIELIRKKCIPHEKWVIKDLLLKAANIHEDSWDGKECYYKLNISESVTKAFDDNKEVYVANFNELYAENFNCETDWPLIKMIVFSILQYYWNEGMSIIEGDIIL